MCSHRKPLPAFLALGLLLVAGAAAAEPAATAGRVPVVGSVADGHPGHLSGNVRGGEAPIASAHVYAYDLVNRELRQVLTDLAGRFQFLALPAGLYHIVAFKAGFVPAVVALTRPEADRPQVVDLHLTAEKQGEGRGGEDYWEVRSRIPPDVLRQIEMLELLGEAVPGGGGTRFDLAQLGRFSAQLEMGMGVDDTFSADAQMAGGRVGLEGRLHDFDFGFAGDFWRLHPGSVATAGAVSGSTSLVSFDLKSQSNARVNLTTGSNRLVTRYQGVETPVDFEHLRFQYVQPLGEGGRSEVAAQVIDERNFYRQGPVDPLEFPLASKTWQVAGSYSQEIGDRALVEAGFTYRDRQSEWAPGSSLLESGAERVDLFSKAGHRVRPAMLIEYGLVSVLKDGELALSPQGGVVLQLNPLWQAIARFSGRVTDWEAESSSRGDFLPVLQREAGGCEQVDDACYQVQLFRQKDDDTLTLGMVHRELGETLRLYFSDDFFDQHESLYLVPGDRLPEIQFALTRRLTPNVLTRLESNLAAGGGGTFFASRRDAYQNEIRYLITSLDTRFQATSTGVFVAFHQLEQELVPLSVGAAPIAPLQSRRLQLKVTQDLDVLLDLPADWALLLNMELSRGQLPAAERRADDDLRHRVLGGIAVKF